MPEKVVSTQIDQLTVLVCVERAHTVMVQHAECVLADTLALIQYVNLFEEGSGTVFVLEVGPEAEAEVWDLQLEIVGFDSFTKHLNHEIFAFFLRDNVNGLFLVQVKLLDRA